MRCDRGKPSRRPPLPNPPASVYITERCFVKMSGQGLLTIWRFSTCERSRHPANKAEFSILMENVETASPRTGNTARRSYLSNGDRSLLLARVAVPKLSRFMPHDPASSRKIISGVCT